METNQQRPLDRTEVHQSAALPHLPWPTVASHSRKGQTQDSEEAPWSSDDNMTLLHHFNLVLQNYQSVTNCKTWCFIAGDFWKYFKMEEFKRDH